MSTFAAEPNRGLVIAPTAVTFVNSDLIIEPTRLPAIYSLAYYPKVAGEFLMGSIKSTSFEKGRRMPV